MIDNTKVAALEAAITDTLDADTLAGQPAWSYAEDDDE